MVRLARQQSKMGPATQVTVSKGAAAWGAIPLSLMPKRFFCQGQWHSTSPKFLLRLEHIVRRDAKKQGKYGMYLSVLNFS